MTDRPTTLAERVLELIDELRGYCRESWDWKYAEAWDAERAAIAAELAALERRAETLAAVVEWQSARIDEESRTAALHNRDRQAAIRERDKARAHCRNHHFEYCETCAAMTGERDQAERERDEARAALAEARNVILAWGHGRMNDDSAIKKVAGLLDPDATRGEEKEDE